MRYVIQHLRPGHQWTEKAATNDEAFARQTLLTIAFAGARYGPTGSYRLIDTEAGDSWAPGAGEPEILATIGDQQ